MDAEIKAKLEEMALKQSFYADPAFMAGAQAAWDLAVKHERERCAEVVFNAKLGATNRDVMKAILNPPTEESGT